MPTIYLRIFASQNADISNDRIYSDIFAAEKILDPIQIQVTTTNNNGLHEVLPATFNGTEFNAGPVINQINDEILDPFHVEGKSVARLLDYNPDNLARDGRVISIYYLAGENERTAQSKIGTNNKQILGSIFIPSDINNDFNRFALAHEIVHILFARAIEKKIARDQFGNDIILRTVEFTNPPPNIPDNPTHSSSDQNLMFPTVPLSDSFVQTEVLPENLFSEIQHQKAGDSPLVFN
ncbi:hypothetical protein JOY42_25880 [Bacillus tropicus]|uniref:hypothetical protein n=1 Tax=Bacillus cereus group TaxID=86661 RepID=UPI0022E46E61|nr:hypothetical protein [Bacillus cereus group sp. BY122LC]MDA1860949.1 hypothetical protein [Bacillus cereus group sp. BY122LC]